MRKFSFVDIWTSIEVSVTVGVAGTRGCGVPADFGRGDIHACDIAGRREKCWWRERLVPHAAPVPGCLGGRGSRWHRRDPHGGQRRLGHVPVQASVRRGGHRLRHLPGPEVRGAHREAASERADPRDRHPSAFQHGDSPDDSAVRWQHGGDRRRPADHYTPARPYAYRLVGATRRRGLGRDRPRGRSGGSD